MSIISLYLPTQLRLFKDKLAMNPIAYRLASGAFWALLGGVASRLFTVISTIVVARIIGKVGFGEFGMVQSTMGIFGVLAGFGLGSTATKYIAEFRSSNQQRASNVVLLTIIVSLITGGILSVSCLLLSPWLASSTLKHPELTYLMQAGSLLLLFANLNGVLLGILAGFEAFKCSAKINLWQGIASPIVAIPMAWLYGVNGVLGSFTINAALGLLFSAVMLRRQLQNYGMSVRYNAEIWREWPILWRYALPAMMSGLMVVPVTWLTNLMLVNRPGGFGELGLFNAANQWRNVIIFLPGLLATAVLPVLSETHGQDNQSDFIRTVSLNVKVTWVVALPIAILVIAFGTPLAALFGRDYSGSAQILDLLMVVCFLIVVNSSIGNALAGSGRMWIGTLMNLGWAFALIVSSYFFIPLLGAKGLALAYLISYLLHSIWQMIYVEVKLAPRSIFPQWKLFLFSLILITVSTVCAYNEIGSMYLSAFVVVFSTIPVFNIIMKSMMNNINYQV